MLFLAGLFALAAYLLGARYDRGSELGGLVLLDDDGPVYRAAGVLCAVMACFAALCFGGYLSYLV